MTVKELADVAGVSENTIHRVVKELMPGYMRRGKKTVFDKAQAFDIMAVVRKKNLVSLPPQSGEVAPQSGEVIPIMAKMMEMMLVLTDRVANIEAEPKQLQLEAPQKATRDALRQTVNKYAASVLNENYREAWNNLYSEIYYRMGKNVKICARNADISPLDYLEREEMLDAAQAIIHELIGEYR